MSTLMQTIKWDFCLQARSFIYPANITSTLMICGFILILPLDDFSPRLTAFLIFLDPAMVGLSFVGAMVLREKSEGTIFALGITPLRSWVYVASKTVTLTVITFASSLVVAFVATEGDFNLPRMLFVLTLSSTLATLIGFACVARVPSMNKLMIHWMWLVALLYIPALTHFEILPEVLTPVIALVPTYAVLIALTWAVDMNVYSTTATLYAFSYLILWCAFGWWWTLREYTQSIITNGR